MEKYNPERREEFVREHLDWIASAFKMPSTIWWSNMGTYVEEINSDLFIETDSYDQFHVKFFLLNEEKINFEHFDMAVNNSFVRLRMSVKVGMIRDNVMNRSSNFEGYLYFFRPNGSSCIIQISRILFTEHVLGRCISGNLIKDGDGKYHEERFGSLTKGVKI